jgi:sulfite exporter TauE/SafE
MLSKTLWDANFKCVVFHSLNLSFKSLSNMAAVLPQIANPYLASLVLGLFYGLAFCTSACFPYVISYIAGIGAGFRRGVIVTSIYNSGRVTAYALLGGLTAILKIYVSDTIFLAFQQYSLIVFGVAIILIGLSIFLRRESSSCTCGAGEGKPIGFSKRITQKFDISPFVMGFTRGLVICPPLLALLLYTVTLSTPIDSVIVATLFGFGTALSPLLLLGGVTGWLLNKAPLFRSWISKIGAGILVLLGFGMLLSALIH